MKLFPPGCFSALNSFNETTFLSILLIDSELMATAADESSC